MEQESRTQRNRGSGRRWLKGCGIGCGVIVLFLIFLGIVGTLAEHPQQTDAKQPAKTADVPAAHKAALPARSAKRTPADHLRAIAHSVLRESNRGMRDRIKRVNVQSIDGELPLAEVVFAANDNLSPDYIRRGLLMDIKAIAEKVKTDMPEIGFLKCVVTFSMKDKFGKASEERVAISGFNRDLLDKIEFGNLTGEEVFALGTPRYLHPALLQDQ